MASWPPSPNTKPSRFPNEPGPHWPKRKAVQLGKPENLTDQSRSKAILAIVENARNHPANSHARELIRLYQHDNLATRGIAQKLNQHGFRTRHGKLFQTETVRRLMGKKTVE